MARSKKTKRGSPEAIAKRRAARALNRLFEEGGAPASMDGRTLKRKKRLIKELKEGRRGNPLKAHEILGHVDELFKMGETLTSVRRMKPRTPPTPSLDDETVAVIRETQETYEFDPKAWKVIGIDLERVFGGESKPKTPQKNTSRRKAIRKKTGKKR